jgi:SAM-dependent methyltransferase
MDHGDHVRLLSEAVERGPAVWADFGSGAGAFTLALADLLGPDSIVYSIDKDRGSLRLQREAMRSRFPAANVRYLVADFTVALDLPPLDGIVMANSLHFVRDKAPTLRLLRSYLKPNGRLALVEYNTDDGNHWVPYPLTYPTWEHLAADCGFGSTRLLATVPSRFLGEIYSALSYRGAGLAVG